MSSSDGEATRCCRLCGAALTHSFVDLGSSPLANGYLTPEQLAPVFPPEQLEAWAKEANTTPEAVLKVLAEALPQLVHHATPEGKLPPDETRLSHLVHKVLGR
jgi:uncharacterized protein YidB (DUF937 family)